GHGNVCGLGQALAELGGDLPFHQPKHEQAMVHTAIGYAKAMRRLATFACTASIGPGATNLVTGAATATTNRLPVLLLPADTFATRRQGPVLQQLQHPASRDWTVNDCLRPVSRFFDRITRPEQLLDALPEAMRVLLDPEECGAVTIALHQDVQGEAYDYPGAFFEPGLWTVARRPPFVDAVRAAAELLRNSVRPLVIVGGGVRYSEAEDALAALCEACSLPVAETSAGKGCGGGPLLIGGIGVNGTSAANELAGDADVVVCVGTRLTDFTTASRSLFQDPDVRFIGINVGAADAHALGGIPVVADARAALEALLPLVSGWQAPSDRTRRAVDARRRWEAALEDDLAVRDGERMSQGQVLRALNEAARADDWVVAAAGSPPGDLLKLWDVPPGAHAHLEFGFSCMGHELPAGIGIRLAQPDAGQVLVVIGDGTFLLSPTELVTAIQERATIVIVVLVNGGFQSIHSLQLGTVGSSFGNEFRVRDRPDGAPDGEGVVVDYVAIARGLGCDAWRVETLRELDDALEQARRCDGVALIECHVEPRRMLVGSGAFWELGVAHAERAAAQRYYG
ncbi:MAG TPA: thiamine pyrophosphate-dependent enzyme, partial [Solirubrobacteraceae bacterium]|nr:thiamine pyrophosphate-dependent enzyme [Solirubrobacteraceae bacterium]